MSDKLNQLAEEYARHVLSNDTALAFIAGHASRDAEVEALVEALEKCRVEMKRNIDNSGVYGLLEKEQAFNSIFNEALRQYKGEK